MSVFFVLFRAFRVACAFIVDEEVYGLERLF